MAQIDFIQTVIAELGELAEAGTGRLWVAYSGGLDSRVLLESAVEAGLTIDGRLKAIHVHHGLQAEADGWVEHCRAQCDRLGVELQVERVAVGRGDSVENQARIARYRVFESLLGESDWLLQGHHANDQAETLLLRLMRASGVRGLASIPRQRKLGAGRLLRPLLNIRRDQLQRFAHQRGLEWLDDPSNDDLTMDRNYLRHQVLPQLQQRWPQAVESISQSSALCGEAQQLLEELAQQDLQVAGQADGGLSIARLSELSVARRNNLLRYWLADHSGELVGCQALQLLWDQLVLAREDAQPQRDFGAFSLRRYQAALYQVVELDLDSSCWSLSLNPEAVSELALPGGVLRAYPDRGRGVVWPRAGSFEVRLRQGGERIKLAGRDGRRSLKKLLQASLLPPWQRQLLPLLYVDGRLQAVADLWIDEAAQAHPGQKSVRLEWLPK